MPRVQLAVRSRKPAAPCTSRKCSCKPGQKAEGSRGLRQVNRNRQTGDEEENALGPHSHTVKCRHGTTLAERPGGSPRCAWGQERGLRMCKVGAAPSFRSPFLHPLRARGSRSVRLRERNPSPRAGANACCLFSSSVLPRPGLRCRCCHRKCWQGRTRKPVLQPEDQKGKPWGRKAPGQGQTPGAALQGPLGSPGPGSSCACVRADPRRPIADLEERAAGGH